MDQKKAKKAMKMAQDFMATQAMEEEMAKASESDLQPADGYVTPMHRIGVVPSAQYSMANQLNGYTTRGQENVIV
tara:strand:+ start:239 stop:463 length:225 start_codon:yes stop_codon:yes gene_type:complete